MISFSLLGQAGRLGNQLWQLASTYGLAVSYDEPVHFPDWAYRPWFSVPDIFFSGNVGIEAHTLVPHIDERAAVYLQDYDLWSAVRDDVWEFLQPSDEAAMWMLQYGWYLDLLKAGPVIAVHVRRGDNAFDPGTPDKYLYHPLRSEMYYSTAIKALPECEVVVFSDDLPWCRENMPRILDRECHFFEGGAVRPKEHEPEYATAPVTDWIDLVAMGMADHHIISNSTYSWWGAFLSEDPTPIYPTNWFGPALSYINTGLMFPESWVPVHDPCVKGQ